MIDDPLLLAGGRVNGLQHNVNPMLD